MTMASLPLDLELLGGRRNQHRRLYPSGFFFRCLLLNRPRGKTSRCDGHRVGIRHEPGDRSAAGIPAYPGLGNE